MPYFYAQIVASLIQRGVILFEAAFLEKNGGAEAMDEMTMP